MAMSLHLAFGVDQPVVDEDPHLSLRVALAHVGVHERRWEWTMAEGGRMGEARALELNVQGDGLSRATFAR